MITLDEGTAAVLWDMSQTLNGFTNPRDIGYVLREASFVRGPLLAAFAAAGVDIDGVERPEIPLLVVGSKAV